MSFRAHLIIYIFAINMSKETMKNGKIIDHAGRFALVDTGVGTYAVGMSSRFGAHDISSFFDLGGRSWDKDPQSVGGGPDAPYGARPAGEEQHRSGHPGP